MTVELFHNKYDLITAMLNIINFHGSEHEAIDGKLVLLEITTLVSLIILYQSVQLSIL